MSDEYTLCPNCRDRYAAPGSTKCHACREQDMIDAEPWLDDENEVGEDEDTEVMEDMYPLELDDLPRCGCPFCYCSNVTVAGETCNECLAGAHQG